MTGFVKLVQVFFLLYITANIVQAQVCGTIGAEAEAIKNRLLQNKVALAQGAVLPRSMQYVPVKFHLVQKNDGSGGILLRNLLDQFCALNNDFRSIGIQFYMNEVNFINDERLYAHHYNYRNMMETYRDSGAMNIWIVDNANPTGFDGYVAGYYTNSKDWLVIQKDEIKSFTFTLPHEVGHFFGLLHTFNGWDSDPWQAIKHGNPAPMMSPNQIPTEFQDKSNCDTAGDFICDTPPDYNFGSFWLTCNYTGGAKDPNDMLADPDESNFMGYFDTCVRSDYHFSTQQKSLMLTDLWNEDRIYVRSNYTPEYLQFSDTPQQELPIPGSTATVYTQVNLQWTPVDGANHYLIEISSTPSYSASTTLSLIATENSLTVKTLAPNKTYYWRVQPFNEYYTCTNNNRSATKNFKTGNLSTTVQEIKEINAWQVSPNPVHNGAAVRLSFQVGTAFEAQIDILNTTGQMVQNLGRKDFPAGAQEMVVTTGNLPAGLYFLSIQTNTGRSVKKIILH